MELKLENGDYVPAANGELARVDGNEALLQRALMRLQARRGGFAALPDYGSRLHTLCRLKPGERAAAARAYAVEALAAEPEMEVGEVRYAEDGAGGALLEVELVCGGRKGALKISV